MEESAPRPRTRVRVAARPPRRRLPHVPRHAAHAEGAQVGYRRVGFLRWRRRTAPPRRRRCPTARPPASSASLARTTIPVRVWDPCINPCAPRSTHSRPRCGGSNPLSIGGPSRRAEAARGGRTGARGRRDLRLRRCRRCPATAQKRRALSGSADTDELVRVRCFGPCRDKARCAANPVDGSRAHGSGYASASARRHARPLRTLPRRSRRAPSPARRCVTARRAPSPSEQYGALTGPHRRQGAPNARRAHVLRVRRRGVHAARRHAARLSGSGDNTVRVWDPIAGKGAPHA